MGSCGGHNLQSLLTHPNAHLGHYNLLLNALIASTPVGHPDTSDLSAIRDEILAIHSEINACSGKATDRVAALVIFREKETGEEKKDIGPSAETARMVGEVRNASPARALTCSLRKSWRRGGPTVTVNLFLSSRSRGRPLFS